MKQEPYWVWENCPADHSCGNGFITPPE